MSLTLERELEFYHSDLYGGNFMFTSIGDYTILYIIDFEEAGFLPHSFTSFALHTVVRPTSIAVAEQISPLIKHNTDNLQVMNLLASFLLTSVRRIGELYSIITLL